jgi:hypothetical protein
MTPLSGNRKTIRMALYVIVAAVALVVWYSEGRSSTFYASQQDNPTQWQQMGVSVASETTRLLTTLGTGLLGALGLLMGGAAGDVRTRHMWAAFASAVSAGVSLFYGYVVHLHLLWMIAYKTLDTTSPFFVTPSHCQFYALLAAGLFFADYAAQNMGSRNET